MRTLLLAALLLPAPSLPLSGQGGPDLAGASRPRPQMDLSRPEGQYKRIHQYALRLILLMRFEEAKSFLEEHLESHPEDPESHYLMSAWHARQGGFEESARWMEQAIGHGLPPGRAVAGPRALFRGAAEASEWFRRRHEEYSHRLVHGPLLGSLGHQGASFWVRCALPARVTVEARPEGGGPAAVGHGRALAGRDHTAVIGVEGLQPGTRYRYRVLVGGRDTGRGGEFRTLAPPGRGIELRLAFGGGAGFVPPHERVWTTIGSFDPHLMLLLGDNVYIDDPVSRIMQRYTYHRRQSRPEWRRLASRVAVFSIWTTTTSAPTTPGAGPRPSFPSGSPTTSTPCSRRTGPTPATGRAGAAGMLVRLPGRRHRLRDARLPVLPDRSPRSGSDHAGAGPDGVAQGHPSPARGDLQGALLVGPLGLPHQGGQPGHLERLPEERRRYSPSSRRGGSGGVLLVSADRHRSDAWRIERPGGYDLYEFNSSRLTNQHVHREMEEAIFSYNRKQSFGLLDFDTTQGDPLATYTVVSIDGERVHSIQVRRSMLQP